MTRVAYWQREGLKLGKAPYERYRSLFGLTEMTLADYRVCEYGCGPLGGMASVMQFKESILVDKDANTYNAWGKAPKNIFPIRWEPGVGMTNIPTGCCHAVFCLNLFDHVRSWHAMCRELARITMAGGLLYFFCHLRSHAARPMSRFERPTCNLRAVESFFGTVPRGLHTTQESFTPSPYWRWEEARVGKDPVNDEPFLRAVWGILRRTDVARELDGAVVH